MLNFRYNHRNFIVKDATYMSLGEIDYYTREFDAQVEKISYKQWIIVIPV